MYHIPCILWYITSYLPYISCFLVLLPPIYVRHRRVTSVLSTCLRLGPVPYWWQSTCLVLGDLCPLRKTRYTKCVNYDTATPSPRGCIACRCMCGVMQTTVSWCIAMTTRFCVHSLPVVLVPGTRWVHIYIDVEGDCCSCGSLAAAGDGAFDSLIADQKRTAGRQQQTQTPGASPRVCVTLRTRIRTHVPGINCTYIPPKMHARRMQDISSKQQKSTYHATYRIARSRIYSPHIGRYIILYHHI